ncbi:MAG: heparinase II/III family protein [Chthoniobacterales bacterium]
MPRHLRFLTLRTSIPAIAAGALFAASGFAADTIKPPVTPIDMKSIRKNHPRVLLTPEKLESLRAKLRDDSDYQRVFQGFYTAAEEILELPPLTYQKEGRRLLQVAQRCEGRIILLSLVYLLSEEPRFLERAEAELLSAAAFPDWNPDHYLDTGELTAALGIGFDWLHSDLSPEARETIATAIYEKGLRTIYLEDGTERSVMFSNWRQVCYGGLAIGALAIAERDPELAQKICTIAVERMAEIVEGWYGPQGAYVEGPGYWSYGTTYQALLIEALHSALGSDYGLDAVPGFEESAFYRVVATGPTGLLFNYSDCDPEGGTDPIQYWFAAHYEIPGIVQSEDLDALISDFDPNYRRDRFSPLVLLWLDHDLLGEDLPDELLSYHDLGSKPVGIFRSSWNDPDALYLGVVGGKGDIAHGHLDAGSWVLDWGGVRWAMELGRVNYNDYESRKINLWDTSPDGSRWQIFHYSNLGHNTLTANNALHDAAGEATITEFTPGSLRSMTLDLTPCFPDSMETVSRKFTVDDNAEIIIRDEWTAHTTLQSLTWRMFTRTHVSVDQRTATLSADGKRLHLEIIQPTGAVFTTRPANELLQDLDTPIPGVQVVEVHLEKPSGFLEVRISAPVDGPEP